VFQQFLDLPRLPRQLLVIGEVLVLAAPALAEERATRLHPIRRFLQNLHPLPLRVVLVVAENSRPHQLPGERIRHENHPAIHPPDAGTEVCQRINPQIDLLMVFERRRDEFFRRAAVHIARVVGHFLQERNSDF
jgi:hypothetical protein